MKKLKTAIPLFMLLGLVVLSCSKDDGTVEIMGETAVEVELTTAELEMMHYMMEEKSWLHY